MVEICWHQPLLRAMLTHAQAHTHTHEQTYSFTESNISHPQAHAHTHKQTYSLQRAIYTCAQAHAHADKKTHSFAGSPQVQGWRVVLEQVKDELIVDLTVRAGHVPLLVRLLCLYPNCQSSVNKPGDDTLSYTTDRIQGKNSLRLKAS